MLKGNRDAVLRRIQPISIHGQMSWEIVFVHADDPAEQLNAARVGSEAIVGQSLEPGETSTLWVVTSDFLFFLFYPHSPQLDPTDRRLAVHGRFLNCLDCRHPIHDAAEGGVLTIEWGGRSRADKK